MEEFEDTKGVIRIGMSKKDRQLNDRKKMYKRTNNDLQKHTYKAKDRATRTSLYPAISTFAVQICYTNKFLLYS